MDELVAAKSLPSTLDLQLDRHVPRHAPCTYREPALSFGNAHAGQTKLLIVEAVFLAQRSEDAHVVYIGSAPGLHIPVLARLFPRMTFDLYDEREHCPMPEGVTVHARLFTESDIPLLEDKVVIADFRSVDSGEPTDECVVADLRLIGQIAVRGHFSRAMFKFRPPFDQPCPPVPAGELWVQPWAPDRSAECRLIVGPGARLFDFDGPAFLNRMHAYNIRRALLDLDPLMASAAASLVAPQSALAIEDVLRLFHDQPARPAGVGREEPGETFGVGTHPFRGSAADRSRFGAAEPVAARGEVLPVSAEAARDITIRIVDRMFGPGTVVVTPHRSLASLLPRNRVVFVSDTADGDVPLLSLAGAVPADPLSSVLVANVEWRGFTWPRRAFLCGPRSGVRGLWVALPNSNVCLCEPTGGVAEALPSGQLEDMVNAALEAWAHCDNRAWCCGLCQMRNSVAEQTTTCWCKAAGVTDHQIIEAQLRHAAAHLHSQFGAVSEMQRDLGIPMMSASTADRPVISVGLNGDYNFSSEPFQGSVPWGQGPSLHWYTNAADGGEGAWRPARLAVDFDECALRCGPRPPVPHLPVLRATCSCGGVPRIAPTMDKVAALPGLHGVSRADMQAIARTHRYATDVNLSAECVKLKRYRRELRLNWAGVQYRDVMWYDSCRLNGLEVVFPEPDMMPSSAAGVHGHPNAANRRKLTIRGVCAAIRHDIELMTAEILLAYNGISRMDDYTLGLVGAVLDHMQVLHSLADNRNVLRPSSAPVHATTEDRFARPGKRYTTMLVENAINAASFDSRITSTCVPGLRPCMLSSETHRACQTMGDQLRPIVDLMTALLLPLRNGDGREYRTAYFIAPAIFGVGMTGVTDKICQIYGGEGTVTFTVMDGGIVTETNISGNAEAYKDIAIAAFGWPSFACSLGSQRVTLTTRPVECTLRPGAGDHLWVNQEVIVKMVVTNDVPVGPVVVSPRPFIVHTFLDTPSRGNVAPSELKDFASADVRHKASVSLQMLEGRRLALPAMETQATGFDEGLVQWTPVTNEMMVANTHLLAAKEEKKTFETSVVTGLRRSTTASTQIMASNRVVDAQILAVTELRAGKTWFAGMRQVAMYCLGPRAASVCLNMARTGESAWSMLWSGSFGEICRAWWTAYCLLIIILNLGRLSLHAVFLGGLGLALVAAEMIHPVDFSQPRWSAWSLGTTSSVLLFFGGRLGSRGVGCGEEDGQFWGTNYACTFDYADAIMWLTLAVKCLMILGARTQKARLWNPMTWRPLLRASVSNAPAIFIGQYAYTQSIHRFYSFVSGETIFFIGFLLVRTMINRRANSVSVVTGRANYTDPTLWCAQSYRALEEPRSYSLVCVNDTTCRGELVSVSVHSEEGRLTIVVPGNVVGESSLAAATAYVRGLPEGAVLIGHKGIVHSAKELWKLQHSDVRVHEFDVTGVSCAISVGPDHVSSDIRYLASTDGTDWRDAVTGRQPDEFYTAPMPVHSTPQLFASFQARRSRAVDPPSASTASIKTPANFAGDDLPLLARSDCGVAAPPFVVPGDCLRDVLPPTAEFDHGYTARGEGWELVADSVSRPCDGRCQLRAAVAITGPIIRERDGAVFPSSFVHGHDACGRATLLSALRKRLLKSRCQFETRPDGSERTPEEYEAQQKFYKKWGQPIGFSEFIRPALVAWREYEFERWHPRLPLPVTPLNFFVATQAPNTQAAVRRRAEVLREPCDVTVLEPLWDVRGFECHARPDPSQPVVNLPFRVFSKMELHVPRVHFDGEPIGDGYRHPHLPASWWVDKRRDARSIAASGDSAEQQAMGGAAIQPVMWEFVINKYSDRFGPTLRDGTDQPTDYVNEPDADCPVWSAVGRSPHEIGHFHTTTSFSRVANIDVAACDKSYFPEHQHGLICQGLDCVASVAPAVYTFVELTCRHVTFVFDVKHDGRACAGRVSVAGFLPSGAPWTSYVNCRNWRLMAHAFVRRHPRFRGRFELLMGGDDAAMYFDDIEVLDAFLAFAAQFNMKLTCNVQPDLATAALFSAHYVRATYRDHTVVVLMGAMMRRLAKLCADPDLTASARGTVTSDQAWGRAWEKTAAAARDYHHIPPLHDFLIRRLQCMRAPYVAPPGAAPGSKITLCRRNLCRQACEHGPRFEVATMTRRQQKSWVQVVRAVEGSERDPRSRAKVEYALNPGVVYDEAEGWLDDLRAFYGPAIDEFLAALADCDPVGPRYPDGALALYDREIATL